MEQSGYTETKGTVAKLEQASLMNPRQIEAQTVSALFPPKEVPRPQVRDPGSPSPALCFGILSRDPYECDL